MGGFLSDPTRVSMPLDSGQPYTVSLSASAPLAGAPSFFTWVFTPLQLLRQG